MDTPRVPLVSFRSLALRGREGTLSDHFDWALYPAEQWAITGPTASGKSLLARAVAGAGQFAGKGAWSAELGTYQSQVPDYVTYIAFDEQPRGKALFHQARWHALNSGASLTVGASLSQDRVWRHNPYEVRENRQPEDITAFEARRDQVIFDLDLAPLLARRLHHLSDGELRRARIAHALLRTPRLLVLDDPFTGLDKDFRVRLRTLLDRLMQAGTQLLLVVSDLTDLPEGITHMLALSRSGHAVIGTRSAVLRSLRTADMLRQHGPRDETAHTRTDAAPEPAAAVVKMQSVNVSHNGVAVLRDVTWTVQQGERWALVGPNGAGKSTLLSLILGDHPQAYANPIELFGRKRGSGESIWEIKRHIGWVAPELHRYFPVDVAVIDVVGSGFFDTLGLTRGFTADQQALLQQWLARLGLAHHTAHPFRTLSKGEQRLALIARALVKAPDLLVLDEPCQGLDAAYVARVLSALGDLTGTNSADGNPLTMIYVTHRPEEFPRSLTHILELDRGRVVRQAKVVSSQTG